MSECNCRVCTNHRDWIGALKPSDAVAKVAFDQMCSAIESAETDLSWYRAIFDGSWPQAETILEQQLAHIRTTSKPSSEPK